MNATSKRRLLKLADFLETKELHGLQRHENAASGLQRLICVLTETYTVSSHPGVSYVYAFEMGEFCKIGLTKDVDMRASHYRVHCPLPLTAGFIQQVRPDRARLLENAVHVALAEHWTHGEWFRVDCAQAELAIVAAREKLGLPENVIFTPPEPAP